MVVPIYQRSRIPCIVLRALQDDLIGSLWQSRELFESSNCTELQLINLQNKNYNGD